MKALALVYYVASAVFVVAACNPIVPPGPFDAADASADCVSACQRMSALGCSVQTNCPSTMTAIEQRKLVRTGAGDLLTCAAIVEAGTKADEVALGACDP